MGRGGEIWKGSRGVFFRGEDDNKDSVLIVKGGECFKREWLLVLIFVG